MLGDQVHELRNYDQFVIIFVNQRVKIPCCLVFQKKGWLSVRFSDNFLWINTLDNKSHSSLRPLSRASIMQEYGASLTINTVVFQSVCYS